MPSNTNCTAKVVINTPTIRDMTFNPVTPKKRCNWVAIIKQVKLSNRTIDSALRTVTKGKT
ncbi:MAG: hypothetical protein QMB27_10950 [Rhodospirillales bacterium]